MSLLIKSGANVNALKNGNGPVINAAIQSGTVDAVRLIMAEDPRFDVDYTKYESPLSLSARQAEALFQEILESEKEKWLQNVKLLDQALISASESGRLESVLVLLRFDHTYTNTTLETSIDCAARSQKWNLVNVLLDHAIKDTAKGRRRDMRLEKMFYLSAASKEERLDIVHKVWGFSGPRIEGDVFAFALYQACVLRKTKTVQWLLDTCSADPNATSSPPAAFFEEDIVVMSADDFGNVLNAAAGTGNAVMVRALVEKGAVLDGDGDYALQIASKEGHLAAVNTLLELGADPDKQVPDSDELGFYSGTALQAACDSNRGGVVAALLSRNANPNIGGGVFARPVVAATQLAEPDILIQLLEDPATEINVSGGHDASTPLINAATHMATEVIDLLIQKGADIDARNASGDTALIMAARRGDRECVDMLCRRGADVTYHSPQHGLAIQVAAQKLHPLCADILSEKMGDTIEQYRDTGMTRNGAVVGLRDEANSRSQTQRRRPRRAQRDHRRTAVRARGCQRAAGECQQQQGLLQDGDRAPQDDELLHRRDFRVAERAAEGHAERANVPPAADRLREGAEGVAGAHQR